MTQQTTDISEDVSNDKTKDCDKMPKSEFYPLLMSTLPSINNCILGQMNENKEQNFMDSYIKDKWNKTPKILGFRKNKIKKLQRSRKPSCRKTSVLSTISNDEKDAYVTNSVESNKELTNIDDEETQCPCSSHLEKEFANETLDKDVDVLFNDLFSQDSEIMNNLFKKKNYKDWKYTQNEENDSKVQILNYTVPLNYSVGPKQSFTECKQVFSKENKSGSHYVVDVQCTSFGVPYADSFNIAIRYCLTRRAGKQSHLRITGEIVFTKKLFGVIKNMISRPTEDALNDYFKCLLQSLKGMDDVSQNTESTVRQRNFSKINRKTRRKTCVQINTSVLQKQNSSSSTIESSSPTIEPKGCFGIKFDPYWCIVILCSFIGFLILAVNIYSLKRLGNLENIILIDRPFSGRETSGCQEVHQKSLFSSEINKFHDIVEKTESLLQQLKVEITKNHKELYSYKNKLET